MRGSTVPHTHTGTDIEFGKGVAGIWSRGYILLSFHIGELILY